MNDWKTVALKEKKKVAARSHSCCSVYCDHQAYKEANTRFASVVSSIYVDGDYVWVHDYHLMRLPYDLRRLHPHCRIGWFLHTPFPSSEVKFEGKIVCEMVDGIVSEWLTLVVNFK